ncbi:MAG: tRNA (guanosine(37)-N1)-methyltransferase TrmD [Elusimicrobia bacterium]|nr:tRNA (guanosine(37)-N1)-methyltransferase TrmD [Elusimicrobiota bacterium]
MRIDFVTLFPELFPPVMDAGILGRARDKGLLSWGCVNPRDFSADKRRRVDDRPFGGGAGMVLMAEPLARAVRRVRTKDAAVIFLSPQGVTFDDAAAVRLSQRERLVLVCGRYEGVDERALRLFDEELSIGDYVLTGGELPALVVADAVVRKIPGVLKKDEAAADESFASGLLDFPQYTRPRVWRGRKAPEVLFSGDHAKIRAWRRQAALASTRRKRPDLIAAGRTRTSGESA